MVIFHCEELPPEYRKAAELVYETLPGEKTAAGEKLTRIFREKGLSLRRTEEGWQIGCGNPGAFVRAMSLAEQFSGEKTGFFYEETPQLETLGIMIDCSRGAVPTVEALKKMTVYLARMGFNAVQLYTEDTFTLPEYPYFGYLRGRYSREELRSYDAFAAAVGVEVVPCIQTLAHLAHMLRWPAFAQVHDCDDILLVGEEKTYQLIDAMFRSMAETLSSRKINIGMDEAHMLGLGKYLERNGYENRFEIILKHLQKVVEIARKYGYSPMMWSDMFFRLANGGQYRTSTVPVAPEVIAKVPQGLQLVYWDYDSSREEQCDRMLAFHKEFNRKIAFAGGVWKWTGFTPDNKKSMHLADVAAGSCRKNGITEVLVTCWGDNGAEASMFSVLPALSYWGEITWANTEESWLSRRFEVCTGCGREDFLEIDSPNLLPGDPCRDQIGFNPAKFYLYQDPMPGLLDSRNPGAREADYYGLCARRLSEAAKRGGAFEAILEVQAKLCAVLEKKVDFGVRLRKAYGLRDRETLARMAREEIPEILCRLQAFLDAYHVQWLAENKPFGLQTTDIRLGGLMQRMQTARERMESFLSGKAASLPELEEELLPWQAGLRGVYWENAASPAGPAGI